MPQTTDPEEIYQELRRRAVEEFGEQRATELEEFLQTTARHVADVEQASADPDLEPMLHG